MDMMTHELKAVEGNAAERAAYERGKNVTKAGVIFLIDRMLIHHRHATIRAVLETLEGQIQREAWRPKEPV